MREKISRFSGPLIRWSLTLALTAISLPASTDDRSQTIAEPGFRPGSEFATAFLDSTSSAKIAVLPTIVRRTDRTAHSFASQKQVIAHLNDSGLLAAISKPVRIKMPPLRRPSQWEIFQFGVDTIGEKLKKYDSGADYVLVVELLVPGDREIFGIEVYILNPQGEDAFSFLLNSHHQMFADAKLVARNSSEAARKQIITDATEVALFALKAQMEQAGSNP